MRLIVYCLAHRRDGRARKKLQPVLSPGGSYRKTPLYDILTVQPALSARNINRR